MINFAIGMKKRMNIAFISFATAVLLLLAVIPHHHHQGLWCNVVELCVADKDINDQHTHHSDDHTSCVERLNFVVTKYVVAKQHIQQHQELHWLSAAVIFSQGTCKFAECVTIIASKSTFSHKLLCVNDSNALRAPPVA